ncbi:hypothetical protein J2TS6_05940 [Paenibacillus albilobatus]|uniref:Uncharacterized protein n=1 Tax=Paenibacillus albilobatus TaxID=2716884 RepID=A0A919XDK1_9BACL|nr:hypothetical protein J2TS6_05940 [Paenibacillus albilobatus]
MLLYTLIAGIPTFTLYRNGTGANKPSAVAGRSYKAAASGKRKPQAGNEA